MEGGRKKDNIIFQKYRLIREIGSGGNSVVYLAHHVSLDILVAIKKVSKTPQNIESFINEANILKILKNSKIPLLYDIQEDEKYHYLIEEYIEGESLVSYVSNQKKISQELIIEYGIQLCEILKYLHGFCKGSIIYLDLQPKNIIVSNGILKLIDFGNAVYLDQNKKRKYFFGTPGFAAPEQYNGGGIDASTDIYGLGTILYYLVTRKKPIKDGNHILDLKEINYISPNLKEIIQKCLKINPSQRFTTVFEVLEKLENLRRVEKPSSIQKKSSLDISIAGTQSRIGVTHISLALADFLNKSGYQALYKEENHSEAIFQLKKHCKRIREKEGTYYYNSIEMRPNYGGAVTYEKGNYPFVIHDFGIITEDNVREYKKGQILFLVGGIKEWEIDKTKDVQKFLCFEEIESLIYLINFTEEKNFFQFMKEESIRALRVPYFPNPLEMCRAGKEFCEGLCEEILVKDLKKTWKVRRK